MLKIGSTVVLLQDVGTVLSGEEGKVSALFKNTAEVKFACGVTYAVPFASLDEFEDVKELPSVSETPSQGVAPKDPTAMVEFLLAHAVSEAGINAEKARIERRIADAQKLIAQLKNEWKGVNAVMPRLRVEARRVSKYRLSDAAKIAELKVAAGAYARK